MSNGIKHIDTYGTTGAAVNGHIKESAGFLQVAIDDSGVLSTINTKLVGEYNLPNVLAAVAVGKHFKVTEDNIKKALEAYTPSNSRSQLTTWNNNKVILDAYNANPTSMKAAIENFAKMEGGQKVLLLGGMMELGDESMAEHSGIVELVKKYNWQAVALVGGDYAKINHPFNNFSTSTEAKTWLQQQHFTGSMLLVKGSRSMQMEKVLEA